MLTDRLAALPPISLLSCAAWRAQLRSGHVPRSKGRFVVNAKARLRFLVRECNQFLS